MLKIGVIGAGHLGKIHLKCLKQIPEIELVGFYDVNTETAKEISETYQTKAFPDEASLIAASDAVDIVSPTTYHFTLAMDAMRQGKHVFIEKPITARLEDSQTIVEYSEQHHLKVQVGHVERFNDAYLNAKHALGNPLFIEAHRLAEFNPRGTDVSVVLDLMIHDIDLVLSMIPHDLIQVSASGVPIISNTPDVANARLTFANGAVANLTSSRIALKHLRKMRLFQPNSYISMDFFDKKVNIMQLRDYKPEDENDLLPLIIDLGADKGKKRIFIESPHEIAVNAIQTELSLFAKSILNNLPCEVSARDGHNALKVAYKIMECMDRQAQWVKEKM